MANMISSSKRLRNDDRYARPRQDKIQVAGFPEFRKVFGYDYIINGKYYIEEKGELIEVKK